jgi:hypothetical protein
MKIYFIKKPCPTCKTKIGLGLFSDRGKIIRCSKCGELLMDDPKSNYILLLLMVSGVILSMVFRHFFGTSALRDMMLLVVFFTLFLFSIRLKVIKKDLVIRNKQTNEISYIDQADWNEILENTKDRENTFEIIEKL